VVVVGEMATDIRAVGVMVLSIKSEKYSRMNGLILVYEATRDPTSQEILNFYE